MLIRNPERPLAYAIPVYIQIAEGLINQIESGDLAPGDRLPPERELSEQLGVNRLTLRRALGVLAAQGLIERRHGVGTYIAAPKFDRKMDVVFRFTRGMETRGFTPGARLISLDQSPVESALTRELDLLPEALVYHILRLRSVNQEPVLLESYTIPVQRFPGLDRFDLENRSIYEVMETDYGAHIERARQSFEPVLASAFEAELLGVPIGAPLMLEKRLSFDQTGRPVEYGRDRYRGDRFRFVTEAAPFELEVPHPGPHPGPLPGPLPGAG
ncbi:MAG TPA: GntR family transcriptional regulator [Anaerolineales bacterium]|nr:GntR family transcriptional regulator [Anaerolineales bacterium]